MLEYENEDYKGYTNTLYYLRVLLHVKIIITLRGYSMYTTLLTDIERTLAISIYITMWLDDTLLNECDDDIILKYIHRFDTEIMPSLTEKHGGDCTNVPGPCMRCHAEDIIYHAKRIAKIMENVNVKYTI